MARTYRRRTAPACTAYSAEFLAHAAGSTGTDETALTVQGRHKWHECGVGARSGHSQLQCLFCKASGTCCANSSKLVALCAQGCRAISGTYVVEQVRNGAILALAPADAPGRALEPLEALARALSSLPPAERCGREECSGHIGLPR